MAERQLFCTTCGGSRAQEIPDGVTTLLVCVDCGGETWATDPGIPLEPGRG